MFGTAPNDSNGLHASVRIERVAGELSKTVDGVLE